MKRYLLIVLLALCFPAVAQTTYYVCAATGSPCNASDSNAGTSKTATWLHAPGMTNFTGSYTAHAGDQIIFRGGDTWHFGNSALAPYVGAKSWSYAHSGAAGSPIYLGTDHTWFTGGSFARPIFNGDDTVTTSTVSSCTYDYGSTNVWSVGTQTHLRLDDVEFTGFCYNGAIDQNNGLVSFGGTDTIVEHMYFHGQTMATPISYDEHAAIHGNGSGFKGDLTQICEYNVFDNSDGSLGTAALGATTEAIQNGCAVVAYNVFVRVSNGVVSTSTILHDNLFHDLYEPQGAVHGNIWNANNDPLTNVGTQAYYNNIEYNTNEGVGVWLWPVPVNGTAYIFNNISYGGSGSSGGVNCYTLGGAAGITVYFYNNTNVSGCNIRLLNNNSDPLFNGTIVFQNNNFIGYGTPGTLSNVRSCDSGATCTVIDNGGEVFLSSATATSQGYVAGNSYQPTSSGNSTVNAGNNLSSLCSTFSSDNALCSGSPMGVAEVAGEGGLIAQSPAIPVNSRGSAWDSGAYQFASGGGTVATPTFSPVAGTYTGTQSVSINTATGGATLCYTTDGSTPTANGAGTCTHGTTYTTAVSVAVSETLQAVGSLSGDTDSAVVSAAYVIQIASPTFSPVAGTYSGTQNVVISSSTSGISICYTIDGTTPTATTPGTCSNGTTLSNGGTISVAVSETVKALGTKAGTTNSSVASAAYVILSFSASPAIIPAHHAGNITLTLTGVATSWTGSTAFSVSCGTLIGKSNISATSETLTVTTSSVCTMTITDTTDSVSSTISVSTATISVVPTSTNISTTPTLTITGVHTLWTSETPAGLFTVTGGTGSSIGTPTINSDTSATVVLTAGSAIATETITDTSTTATATVSILGEVLTIIVTGTGSVTSSPSGINCSAVCSATFPPKTLITLTSSGGSLNSFSQGCAGVSCVFNIVSNTSVTALFGCGGSSVACFKNSSDSVIVQNLVAGCNSLIVAALCGTATTTYSISGNVVSISAPNSFGPYALVGISGCSAATQLNGLHFVTNSNTTGSVVSGNVYNSQGTLITPANVSSTAETKCYLQGQGWQPWVLSPFPAPGTTGCVNGNGQPSCSPQTIAVPVMGTWALDWATPQAGATPNYAPANCWVTMVDQSFAGNGNSFGGSSSGETNDLNVSFGDANSGYFYSVVNGGSTKIAHGHISPNYCGTGVPGFVPDVTAVANTWSQGNFGGYGGFSRNPNEGPGINQAYWYSISVPTYADNFDPKLQVVLLTYSSGAVTAGAPTVILDIPTACSGFKYTQIGNGMQGQEVQFRVDNRAFGSHRFYFGLGTGNQGALTRNTTFEYDQATGICVTRDVAGMTGTNVNLVHVSAQTGAGGYALTDTLGVSQAGCTATFQPTSLGASNVLAGVSIVNGGTGCSNALGVTVTGGSGTGGTVDIAGIGTIGTTGNIWPSGATSPIAMQFGPTGMHSGNCDLSMTYCNIADTVKYPDGSDCTTVHDGGLVGGCETMIWPWQDINPLHMLPQYTGHGNIGCKYQGYADNGSTYVGLGPNLNGTAIDVFKWQNIDPATDGTSPHGSWADPNCNQSIPILLTMGPNIQAQETNPPNYTWAFGEGFLGVMKDSTKLVPDTRWFTRYYTNQDPLCGTSFNVYGIWEMSPDGLFIITNSNMNGVPTGSASTYPYFGNTGLGVDNSGACYFGMYSVMLNAQSFASSIVQAPVNPILLANKGGK